MLSFPNAKINIGLNVIRKRPDGFHDIESVFCPINSQDILEIIPVPDINNPSSFNFTGIHIDSSMENNLCYKAYQILQNDYKIPPVVLNLHKIIPMGAGLGGGSADAAFTITLLNTVFRLNISKEQMKQYAAMLGSDCAFFIENKPCIATGRGEILQPVELNLQGLNLLIVNPGVHISTKEAYSGVKPAKPETALKELIMQPMDSWKDNIRNDFEESVFINHPIIKEIKEEMYGIGAIYTSMTGSGSTVYGIFNEKPEIPDRFQTMFFKTCYFI